jgi:hypothetical protein
MLSHPWLQAMEQQIELQRIKEEAWEAQLINHFNKLIKTVNAFSKAQEVFQNCG